MTTPTTDTLEQLALQRIARVMVEEAELLPDDSALRWRLVANAQRLLGARVRSETARDMQRLLTTG